MFGCLGPMFGCLTSSPQGQDDEPWDPARADPNDPCTLAGRYNDGLCDPACAHPDPDCSADDLTRAAYVIAEIEAFNAALDEGARTDKYCRMAESPFVFFRGSDHLFWADFAGDPRFTVFGGADTRIWVQGDLHAQNYGSFDNDDGEIVYDLNDFDEVVLADYQWDVWRMAASIPLTAEGIGGFSGAQVAGFIDDFSESYLDALASYRGNDSELSVSFDKDSSYGRIDEFLVGVEAEYSRHEMLRRWTDKNDGMRSFDLSLANLAATDAATDSAIEAAMVDYVATTGGMLSGLEGYFNLKDVAQRLNAGTGSLGVPRYYVLIEGMTDDPDDDRILDVKRQGEPSAYPYLSADELAHLALATAHHAERAVLGYRALLADADDHLGWLWLADGIYSVRERSPYKDEFPLDMLDTTTRFGHVAEQWGTILATAHARSDKDYRSDVIPYSFDKNVDDYTDTRHAAFRAQVRDLAQAYADQVREDYRAFLGELATPERCGAP
jgi:uncharacterized protein (DUF2252 family)